MSNIHICFAKGKNCWNYYETIHSCIGCGCCSKKTKERQKNRLKVLKRLLAEKLNFHDWCEDAQIKAIQERNIKKDIRYFKKKIQYYEKVIAEKEVTNDNF